jgi:hypothetical protein
MDGPRPRRWRIGQESEQPGPRLIAGYDAEAGTVLLPPHIRRLPIKEQLEWAKKGGMILAPNVSGGAYSMFEMMQPFAVNDSVAVTAAAETILSQATILTLPANFFAFPGKSLWLHGTCKQSNVVTTPGTYTFRLRYGTGVVGDTLLVAGGAIVPDPVAVTDNLVTIDIWIKALLTGPLATSLTLLAHGIVNFANSDASLASDKAKYLPAGGTSLANVASLDGTIAKTLTLTVAPTVTTGSITLRDVWVVAMN